MMMAFSLFLLFGSQLLRSHREQGLRLVHSFTLERPPRLA